MSMYVEVLSGALEGWTLELTDDALLHYVLACRAALPAHELGAGGSAHSSLVAEVTYDRALIYLAASSGIDVSPQHFSHPQIERDRLESALAGRGIDLDLLARRAPLGLDGAGAAPEPKSRRPTPET